MRSGPIYHSSPLGVEFFAARQQSAIQSGVLGGLVGMEAAERDSMKKHVQNTKVNMNIYKYACVCVYVNIPYIYIESVYIYVYIIYIYTYIIFILFRCNCTYLRDFCNHHLKIGFQPTCIWFCRHELLWRRPFCRLAF